MSGMMEKASINNALEANLFRQISSESCGNRHITGTGGQLDFAYGAYHSAWEILYMLHINHKRQGQQIKNPVIAA